MSTRTPKQWQTLIEQQVASGLSQARFCKEQGLCSKYFSLRKRQLTGIGGEKFVRVHPSKPLPPESLLDWQLQVGEVKVRVWPASVEQIVDLIKGLA